MNTILTSTSPEIAEGTPGFAGLRLTQHRSLFLTPRKPLDTLPLLVETGGASLIQSGSFVSSEIPFFQSFPELRRPMRERSEHRSRELRWIQAHRKQLQKRAGQWIVLEGDTIVASGEDPIAVVREARTKGIRVPFVYRIEHRRRERTAYFGL